MPFGRHRPDAPFMPVGHDVGFDTFNPMTPSPCPFIRSLTTDEWDSNLRTETASYLTSPVQLSRGKNRKHLGSGRGFLLLF